MLVCLNVFVNFSIRCCIWICSFNRFTIHCTFFSIITLMLFFQCSYFEYLYSKVSINYSSCTYWHSAYFVYSGILAVLLIINTQNINTVFCNGDKKSKMHKSKRVCNQIWGICFTRYSSRFTFRLLLGFRFNYINKWERQNKPKKPLKKLFVQVISYCK